MGPRVILLLKHHNTYFLHGLAMHGTVCVLPILLDVALSFVL